MYSIEKYIFLFIFADFKFYRAQGAHFNLLKFRMIFSFIDIIKCMEKAELYKIKINFELFYYICYNYKVIEYFMINLISVLEFFDIIKKMHKKIKR